jgi:hypothetical protein
MPAVIFEARKVWTLYTLDLFVDTQFPSAIMSYSTNPVGLVVPTRKPAPAAVPEEREEKTHTTSQRYLSTRGGSYGVRNPIEANC